jgi:hypothetical protein
MRFLSSRPRHSLKPFPFLVLVLLAVGHLACTDNKIGRPCELTVTDDAGAGSGSNATINDQALECPTRICLMPAAVKTVTPPTTSLCTADCESDDDCEDAESRDKSDTTDRRCTSGFSCAVATLAGDFCCRRMCICRDFIDVPPGGFQTPAVCKPGNSTCINVR